jgi:hypothetical protein
MPQAEIFGWGGARGWMAVDLATVAGDVQEEDAKRMASSTKRKLNVNRKQ